MKNYISLLALAVALILQGCDYVDGPFTEGGGTDTTTTDSVVRKVLLEDYTGHGCQTCPRAHEEAQRLIDTYGDRLIVMAIHASSTWAAPQPVSGHPTSFQYDFRTTAGSAIAQAFGIINSSDFPALPFPIGSVDRQDPNLWGTWEDSVTSRLAMPAEAGLKISNSYDSGSRTVSTTVTVKGVSDIADTTNLCVYLLEDSIVNWQKNNGVYDSLYLHRHVFRGALTPALGESIGTVSSGQSIVKTYTAALPRTDIVASKVYVVAVLTNRDSKKVIQVEEKKLTP